MAQTSTQPLEYPPAIHHRSKFLSAIEAAPILATFLEASRKAPHLHPDALLLSEGVRHGPKSGASGGIAIHHLRRIEAGLRGEALEAETKEELRAQFGEEAVPIVSGLDAMTGAENAGDDTRVDAVIEASEQKRNEEAAPRAQESEKAKRKREKKERAEREKAQKRKREEGDEDEEPTETVVKEEPAANEDKPRKKQKKGKTVNSEVKPVQVKKESPSASSSKKVKKEKDKDSKVQLKDIPAKDDEWQTQQEYEQSQTILEGEVGEREGAPVMKEGGPPPVVVEHDAKGDVKVPSKPKTEAEKAERRAAKKARQAELRAKQSKGG